MMLSSDTTRLLGWAIVVAVVVLGMMIGAAYLVPLPDRLEAADATVVEWRDGTAAHVFLSADDRLRMPADLDDIDPEYVRSVLAVEDEHFWWHPGVDPLAVARASWSNLMSGRVVSGASTVTMQLVRLLEPRPRTFRSKVIEAFRAVQLEFRLSKREILEAYLSYVPYGRNYEGVETASYLYFGKSPRTLTPAEMATLVAVPQAPGARFPAGGGREALREARGDILREMARDGALDAKRSVPSPDALVEQAGDRALPRETEPIPKQAPHAARWLKHAHPDERRIESTLDREIQQTVADEFDERRARLQARGIHNGAGVVMEHRTGAIRALVGNFDFFDPGHGGQIPGFDVARSTGSVLKPVIYAESIDSGYAAAKHLVTDVPTSFGGFRPENFEESYAGLIRLEEALSQSKNIPFVRLIEEIGVNSFLTTLRRLGVDGFERPPTDYGVSVAVGGLALTPLEVARIYAAFARQGRSVQSHAVKSEISDRRESVAPQPIGRGAVWLTNRALRKRDRPDFPARRQLTSVSKGIHWKTGTSARNRDAWSVGFGPDYTAAVWVGNFDNSRSPSLIGAEAAGPLFFDVLEAIESRSSGGERERPEELTEVEVCAFSGHLPNESCPNRDEALMVRSNVATERCPYHVERRVGSRSGLAVPTGCDADLEVETRTFVQLPSGAGRWMRNRLGRIEQPPATHPDCASERSVQIAAPPRITWPPPHHAIVLLRMMPAREQQVPLEADVQGGGAELHWFVDGEFLGSKSADRPVWWTPSPGEHDIVVMDEAGRSHERSVTVRWRERRYPTIQQ